jgi:hypothetical protein
MMVRSGLNYLRFHPTFASDPASFGSELTLILFQSALEHLLRNSYYLSFLWLLLLCFLMICYSVKLVALWRGTSQKRPPEVPRGAQQEGIEHTRPRISSFDHSPTGGSITDPSTSISSYFTTLYLMLRLQNEEWDMTLIFKLVSRKTIQNTSGSRGMKSWRKKVKLFL